MKYAKRLVRSQPEPVARRTGGAPSGQMPSQNPVDDFDATFARRFFRADLSAQERPPAQGRRAVPLVFASRGCLRVKRIYRFRNWITKRGRWTDFLRRSQAPVSAGPADVCRDGQSLRRVLTRATSGASTQGTTSASPLNNPPPCTSPAPSDTQPPWHEPETDSPDERARAFTNGVAAYVKQVRAHFGLTREALAEALGIGLGPIATVEDGDGNPETAAQLYVLVKDYRLRVASRAKMMRQR